MKSSSVMDQPGLLPATERGEGFFYCGHCNHVIELPEDADAAQTFKCWRCHKWAVTWKFPMKPRVKARPPAVNPDSEVAREWFSKLREAIS